MAEKYLGTSFEIHGGGLDLKFPHHENEIAQSRALGHPFAHIWMHNGMLSMRGSEMHKSLGNDVSLKDALDRWGRETLLFFFMTGHWRKPLDYSEETLEQARAQLEGFRNVFRSPSEPVGDWTELEAALDDDFNTPEALAVMHGWRDHELLRRAFGLFGLESIAEVENAPSHVAELAERRLQARDAKDFAESDRLRDEIGAAGWEVRDVACAPGYVLVRRS
jgi:cysteinyl-tRNA synthetase